MKAIRLMLADIAAGLFFSLVLASSVQAQLPLWQHSYLSGLSVESANYYVSSAKLSPNLYVHAGAIAVGTGTPSGTTYPYFVFTYAQGTYLRNLILTPNQFLGAGNVVSNGDGSFTCDGFSSSAGPSSIVQHTLVKLNQQGQLLWQTNFHGPDALGRIISRVATGMVRTPDGYVVAANTNFYTMPTGNTRIERQTINRFNNQGRLVWERTFPGNAELERLGMTGRPPDMPDCLAFDLEPLAHYAEWIGRLTINWPMPYQQWYRWAANGHFSIESIDPESRFVRGMPDWKDLVLTWSELEALPSSWGAILGQWRGIYYIHDTARNAGYVGSAYGHDNLLGRWRAYARSGHGGNKELRNSAPSDLRFSILQRTSPDMDANDVIALEASWKARLHTREVGLNCN